MITSDELPGPSPRYRRGTRDFGLKVDWQFTFAGQGSVLEPGPEAVLVDVGNRLEPGALDQHQDGTLARSTGELLLRHPEYVYDHLVGPWLDRARRGEDLSGEMFQPWLVTHRLPDFDATVSALLVRCLVETGGCPGWAPALVDYAARVDQGDYSIDLDRPETYTDAIHLGFLVQAHLHEEEGGSDQQMIEWGIAFLLRSITAICAARAADEHAGDLSEWTHFSPGQPGVGAWRSMPEYTGVAEELQRDRDRFQEDQAAALCRDIPLPAVEDGRPRPTRALILDRPPRARLNKYWVRASGCPLFMCPIASRDGTTSPGHWPRVIISLPGDSCGEGQVSLAGLGQALEEAEHAHRVETGGDGRHGSPRFAEAWCTNQDPWYDGRGHGHNIVDAPRDGTRLSYGQVKDIVLTFAERQAGRDDGRSSVDLTLLLRDVPAGAPSTERKRCKGKDQAMDLLLSESHTEELSPEELPVALRRPPDGMKFRRIRRVWAPAGRQSRRESHVVGTVLQVDLASPPHAVPRRLDLDRYLGAARNEGLLMGSVVSLDVSMRTPRKEDPSIEEHIGAPPMEKVEKRLLEALEVQEEVVAYWRPGLPNAPTTAHLEFADRLLLMALQASMLHHLRQRMRHALDDQGRVHGAEAIRADLLKFQIRYHDWVSTSTGVLGRFSEHMTEVLALRGSLMEVAKETDRIANVARDEVEGKIEALLFLVGLGAIFEGWGSLVELGIREEPWWPITFNLPFGIAGLFAVVYVIYGQVIKRQRNERAHDSKR